MNLGSASPKKVELQDTTPYVADNQGYPVCSLEAQMSPEHEMGIDEACHSSSSTSSSYDNKNCGFPIPQGTPTFHMDKRWNSIYTVCMLNSPDAQHHVKDTNVPVSAHNLLQGRSQIPSNGQHDFSLQENIRTNNVSDSKFLCKRTDQCGLSRASVCTEAASANVLDVIEEVYSGKTVRKFDATTSVLDVRSEESEIFKKHFGSLSSTHKTERADSAKRRRHSGRFTVQRDYIGSCERLLNSPSRYLGGKSQRSVEETLQFPSEEQAPSTFKQDPKDVTQSFCAENKRIEPTGEQNQCFLGDKEAEQKIMACSEALLALDSAAGNAIQLFSDLNTPKIREEISSFHGAELYAKAARLLPIVLDKVNVVAELVTKNSETLNSQSLS